MISDNDSILSSNIDKRINTLKKNLTGKNIEMRYTKSDDNLLRGVRAHKKNLNSSIIGMQMYLKGMATLEKKRRFIEKSKKQLEIKENQLIRQKPRINNKSHFLSRSRSMDGLKVEERLLQKGKEMEKRKHDKIMQLSFDLGHRRNIKSKKLNNKFDSLYIDAKKKEEEKQKLIDNYYKKKYTFKPQISEKSKNLSKEKYDEIIQKGKERNKKVKEEIEKEMKKKIGSRTKRHNNNKNQINTNISNKINKNNYSYTKESYERELRKKISELNEEKIYISSQKKTQWLSHINEIVKKTKFEKYKKLFDMCGGENGILIIKNIKLSKIDKNVLNEVTNLLDEIMHGNTDSISFKEFCEQADKFLSK